VDHLNFKILVPAIFLAWLLPAPGIQCQEREIKPGDAIEIVVYEHEELSETVVVSPDGKVDSPFLKGIPVVNMTLERFEELLTTQLSRYLERSPLVKVRFVESYPIKVMVLGQVAQPGVYSVQNTSTPQGAVGQAGGFLPGAQLSQIKLIREEGDAANVQVVNLEKFYLEGDPAYLPLLKDGDTIVVPGNPLATGVKVIGGVKNPGNYEIFFRASILDAIYLAGGPTKDARLGKVSVVSQNGQKSHQAHYDVKHILESGNMGTNGNGTLPLVVPGDVVYVPQGTSVWKQFVQVMRDVATFGSLFLIIRYGRRY
jgi:polysaccharide export outer membrane protein